MVENLNMYLEKIKTVHGNICAGIVLGTRMTLAAMRELELDPTRKNKNLIVFVEIDRCMTDAVQTITGCTLGQRTLKYVNYGKFGATFYDMALKRAVRVTERMGLRDKVGEDVYTAFSTLPDEELLKVEEVEISLDGTDLPGKPQRSKECKQCGELIFDGQREVNASRGLLCRACADRPYYKPKGKKNTMKGKM